MQICSNDDDNGNLEEKITDDTALNSNNLTNDDYLMTASSFGQSNQSVVNSTTSESVEGRCNHSIEGNFKYDTGTYTLCYLKRYSLLSGLESKINGPWHISLYHYIINGHARFRFFLWDSFCHPFSHC